MRLRPLSMKSANIAEIMEKTGRGERIRTSGPCLPKTMRLPSHGGFPWHSRAAKCRFVRFVPVCFRAKVHSGPSAPVLAGWPA